MFRRIKPAQSQCSHSESASYSSCPMVVKSSNMFFFVKGATACLWLHKLEHGHCQRELQPVLQRKHFCQRSHLHGSLWSLLHRSHWWTENIGVTAGNVVIRCLYDITLDLAQVLLLEPTFPEIWKTPHTPFQRWISDLIHPASLPLSREHCWPLLEPMSPTCTLACRCSRQKYLLRFTFHLSRPGLSLQTKPVGWRRSTCSSTTKVTSMTLSCVSQLGLATVLHLSFQNGLIALKEQTKNETCTRPSLRWAWLLSLPMINDHTEQGDEEDWGGTNLTAYKGVYDNWDTEKKGSKCIPPSLPKYN